MRKAICGEKGSELKDDPRMPTDFLNRENIFHMTIICHRKYI